MIFFLWQWKKLDIYFSNYGGPELPLFKAKYEPSTQEHLPCTNLVLILHFISWLCFSTITKKKYVEILKKKKKKNFRSDGLKESKQKEVQQQP